MIERNHTGWFLISEQINKRRTTNEDNKGTDGTAEDPADFLEP